MKNERSWKTVIYRSKEHLSVYESDNQMDRISFKEIMKVLENKINSTIYFVSKGKLYGVITSGDVVRAVNDKIEEVVVNKNFTKLKDGEYYKALEIFKDREKINALPIVNDDGNIIGEYNRHDDLLSIHVGYGLEEKNIEKIGKKYNKIALVLPDRDIKSKAEIISLIREKLICSCEKVDILYGTEFVEKYKDYDGIISVDKDNSWAIGVMARIKELDHFFQKRETLLEAADATDIAKIPEAAEETLCVINDSGINVVNLYLDMESEYARNFMKNVRKKYELIDTNPSEVYTVVPEIADGFFEGLNSEDYLKHVGNERDLELYTINGLTFPKDYEGKYRTWKDGIRKTFSQPNNSIKTVWIFGPCFIRGALVEDKHTIPTMIQEMLNDSGYKVKVVNMGDFMKGFHRLRRLRSVFNEEMKTGDIVFTYFDNHKYECVPNIDLMETIKENNPSYDWFTQYPFHCNYKVNRLYADRMFQELIDNQDLVTASYEKSDNIKFEDFFLIGKYFDKINVNDYTVIGSIVMNCNPFTYGHRYLIEQAKAQCDLLVIFVVSEDKSIFSFNSRYAMVKEGTKDMDNVLVSPSGYNVLSQNNFPEYFLKIVDDDTIKNAEMDIEIFARDIAPHLNIKKRFVGEELTDEVTRHYNNAMKKILPNYGIELVEIPRKKLDGKAISATSVRECLKNNDMEGLRKLVPQSTLDIMFYECK